MAANSMVVATFDNHQQAENAVKAMAEGGVDMKRLSIVGRDYHTEEQVLGFYNTGDRVKFWGKLGAFWGGMWGLFLGALVLAVPGVGHIVILGQLATMVASAIEGAVVVGGASAIGAALYGIGIPKDSVVQYESQLKADNFLVLLHGTADEVAKARQILDSHGPASVTVHDVKDPTTLATAQPA